jgi:Ino eighty subunit 2
MSRPRRGVATPALANTNPSSSVTVSRSPSNSPEDRRKSIKLTVKMPSSKLREVTSQSSVGRSIAVNSRDTFEAGEIMTGKRSTRAQDNSKLKEYNQDTDPEAWDESDESEDEMDVEPPSPIEAPSTTEDESDEDDDEEMYEAPPLPPMKKNPRIVQASTLHQTPKPNPKPTANPSLVVTPAIDGPIKSVEEKEMEMDNDEDDELSELESNGEEGEQDETNIDAEGDEDELGGEEDAEGDEDIDAEGEVDSDDETPGSGTGTPKPQTKRQRGQDEGAFLALPMEPQIKKILTADEHRMRRAEMARRRKNLSEKRNEEEKVRLGPSRVASCINAYLFCRCQLSTGFSNDKSLSVGARQ